MSLAGLRDISMIETPPEGRRPVRTYVGPYDEDLVRRGDRARARARRPGLLPPQPDRHACPRSPSGCAGWCRRRGRRSPRPDGREPSSRRRCSSFLRGDADCLVTTTIIESGLDIPTANTLIVERADQLGLAQAYQIRGRVGRSRERAFAYLLYPSAEALTEEAAARLSTLADHTELGSGFKIAMRDLDIRGAGDLLGEEQSGPRRRGRLRALLPDDRRGGRRGRGSRRGGEEAPEPVRFDVPVDAYLPASFIPFEAAKIDVHRRIVAAREPGELRAIRDELGDRFGPLAARGREPAGAAAGPDRARPGRRPQRRAPRRPPQRHRGRARLRAGRRRCGEQVEGALYEWREKTAVGPGPGRARGAARTRCWRWPPRSARGKSARQAANEICCPPRESESGQETRLWEQAGRRRARHAARQGPRLRCAGSRCSVFGALFIVLFVDLRDRRGHRRPQRPLRRRRPGRGRARATRHDQRSGIRARARTGSGRRAEKRQSRNPATKYEELKEAALGSAARLDLDPGARPKKWASR